MRARRGRLLSAHDDPAENPWPTKHVVIGGKLVRDAGSTPAASTIWIHRAGPEASGLLRWVVQCSGHWGPPRHPPPEAQPLPHHGFSAARAPRTREGPDRHDLHVLRGSCACVFRSFHSLPTPAPPPLQPPPSPVNSPNFAEGGAEALGVDLVRRFSIGTVVGANPIQSLAVRITVNNAPAPCDPGRP